MIALSLAACGKKAAPPAEGGETAAANAAPAGAAPTGKVITVNMISDEKSNRFEPSEIEAHPGDVLRFTIVVGVHNVHFLADSNPGVPNLPPPSDLLQLPGQTLDVPVNFAPGKSYYFQCDPHAALGMRGHLEVEAEEH
jgi:plastocyanin